MAEEMQSIRLAHKRLYSMASRRSMREMEEILARFLEQELAGLDEAACEKLMKLLQFPDLDLLNWLLGVTEPSNHADIVLLERLRRYR